MVRGVANSLAFAGAAWLAGACCLPAQACDLSESERATVAAVIDGETLKLTDGRTVRLIGAKAPMPPLGWRSDFTVSVERKDAGAFAAAGIDLKALAGKRLRVRGFLAWRNGPMIEASHPEQIELLPDGPEVRPPPRSTGPAIAL